MSFNAAVAERFSQISKMMELLGENPFKSNAHAKVSRIVSDLTQDLEPIAKGPDAAAKLMEIEGVGQSSAAKIVEFARTGKIRELEELRAKVPAGLLPAMEIPGLGPKTVAMLWKEAGVIDLTGIKKIIDDGSILNLPRMGEKAVTKIKESITLAEQGQQRLYLGIAAPIADRIVERLKKIKGVKQVAYAGSLRRGKETIGDIDILVSTTSPDAVSEAFRKMAEVRHVIAAGDTKSSVRFAVNPSLGRWDMEGKEGVESAEPTVQVDLRVVPHASWGAALLYFTGSKEHNVRLRERAQAKSLTLNEYGLFPEDNEKEPPQKRGVKPLAGKTEAEVFAALGLAWIPPEMREDRGELDAFELSPTSTERKPAAATLKPKTAKAARKPDAETAASTRIPNLHFPKPIELADIKAELHAHTTASDGRMSIVELATMARARGFHTIAITDHSKSSVIANGLSPDRLCKHIKAIHEARKQVPGINILAGSEVDILSDGSLDYDDDLLGELDIVVASPHAALSQDPATATKRLLKAIRHPLVNILGHPTGRLINKRPGLSPDMAELFAAAKEHDVALEINAHWLRLDLRDTHVRAAVDAGCLIAIDCDVHEAEDCDNLRYGVATGRRGWLTADKCVNAWEADRLYDWLR